MFSWQAGASFGRHVPSTGARVSVVAPLGDLVGPVAPAAIATASVAPASSEDATPASKEWFARVNHSFG